MIRPHAIKRQAPSAPFLLVDAGNSRIKWALAAGPDRFLAQGVFAHGEDGPAATANRAAEPEWSLLPVPCGAWISNVAGPAAGERIDALLERHWPRLPRTTIRAQARQCGVVNSYAEPGGLGSDRWAALIGAHAAFPGEDLLIATFGTATTLEALRADGTFAGGLIAPGWTLMMRALGEHTAQLPTIAADSARELTSLIGRTSGRTSGRDPLQWFATDTRQAISAGSLLAQAGLVERAWRELSHAWRASVKLVLGGGAADEVARALTTPCARHDGLVLAGLALIAAENVRELGGVQEVRDIR
jgi:type III pantothenate kinase